MTPASPRRASHSVGVARQYCGQLGKQDNCQVAVTLSLASDHASLPIAHRLYLPQPWADDPARRARAGVPDDVAFQTKPQIALAQIRAAVHRRRAARPGAGRCRIRRRHRVSGRHHRTRPGLCRRHPVPHQPVAAGHGAAAAQALERTRPAAVVDPARCRACAGLGQGRWRRACPSSAWRRVTWREGSNTTLASRFAAVRVRPAHRDYNRADAAARGMAADRMAQGRAGAHQILALHPAAHHDPARPGRSGQAALADRARLPGPQTGTRPRPLRRARLARLPSPRDALHRRLRLPDRRAGRLSPLRRVLAAIPPNTCPTRKLPTPRRSRSGLSATSLGQ